MRSVCAVLTAAVGCLLVGIGAASAADSSTTTVQVQVQLSSRTSLHVSSHLLQFDVSDPSRPPTAAVDFSAGARVPSASDVVLTVEPLHGVEGPGGAADVDAAVTFSGDGDGVRTGILESSMPTLAGRWHGSGLHQGRLVFTLHTNASGTYSVPVRFVLSMP
jgi:hypothetical protein